MVIYNIENNTNKTYVSLFAFSFFFKFLEKMFPNKVPPDGKATYFKV